MYHSQAVPLFPSLSPESRELNGEALRLNQSHSDRSTHRTSDRRQLKVAETGLHEAILPEALAAPGVSNMCGLIQKRKVKSVLRQKDIKNKIKRDEG